ncbi:MAG TPA: hypothetical protein VGB99_15415 [Acidobacteriota bacterium]
MKADFDSEVGAALRSNLTAWRELYTRRYQLFLGPKELRELVDLGRQLAAIQRDFATAPTVQIRREAETEARAILALMERFLERLQRPGEKPPIRLKSWSGQTATRTPLRPRPSRRR